MSKIHTLTPLLYFVLWKPKYDFAKKLIKEDKIYYHKFKSTKDFDKLIHKMKICFNCDDETITKYKEIFHKKEK